MVLSSRPIPPCIAAFDEYPKLRLQDLTKNDIISYIEAQIKDKKYMHLLSEFQPEDVDKLVQEISSRSSGIFLWVVLVVKSLLRGLIDGDQMDDLRRRLYQYPRELEPLYKHMLDGVDELHRVQASKYLQILLKSIKVQLRWPLTLLQMSFADEYDLEAVLKIPWREISDIEVASHCKRIERRIVSRCCGLIEIENQTVDHPFRPRDSAINFLHKSVVDFLEKPETWASVTSLTAGIDYDTNWALACSCLLMLKTFSRANRPREVEKQFVFPLLRYCRDGEKSSGKANVGFLRELSIFLVASGRSKGGDVSYLLSQYLGSDARRPFKGLKQVSTSLVLSVCHCLPLHLQEELEACPPAYLTKDGAALLWTAVSIDVIYVAGCEFYLPALEETVECLLKNAADPNLAFDGQSSPWTLTLSEVSAICSWKSESKGDIGEGIILTIGLTYLKICELFLSHGAYANAVFYPRASRKQATVNNVLQFFQIEQNSALSALAVIEEFFRDDFEWLPSIFCTKNPQWKEQMQIVRRRLFSLLQEQGAESRGWAGGKQIFGPLEKTPLSTIVKRSLVSVSQHKDVVLHSRLETESSSTSVGRQKHDVVQPCLQTESLSGSGPQCINDGVHSKLEIESISGSAAQHIDGAVCAGPETKSSSAVVGQQENEGVRPDLETNAGKGLRARFKNWRISRSVSPRGN